MREETPMRKATVRIGHDPDVESPCEYDGMKLGA